jgi:hypothetical protein
VGGAPDADVAVVEMGLHEPTIASGLHHWKTNIRNLHAPEQVAGI